MNKFFAILLVSPFGLLSADSGGTAYSGSVAETIVNDASGTMTNFLADVIPYVVVVVGTGLALWGAVRLVGILKSAFIAGVFSSVR